MVVSSGIYFVKTRLRMVLEMSMESFVLLLVADKSVDIDVAVAADLLWWKRRLQMEPCTQKERQTEQLPTSLPQAPARDVSMGPCLF